MKSLNEGNFLQVWLPGTDIGSPVPPIPGLTPVVGTTQSRILAMYGIKQRHTMYTISLWTIMNWTTFKTHSKQQQATAVHTVDKCKSPVAVAISPSSSACIANFSTHLSQSGRMVHVQEPLNMQIWAAHLIIRGNFFSKTSDNEHSVTQVYEVAQT